MESSNGSTSDLRGKRKLASSPSSSALHRPSKHMRDDDYSDAVSDGELFAEIEDRGAFPTTTEDIDIMDDVPPQLLTLPPTAGMHDSAEWQRTIEKVVRNVVSIRFSQTCSFDTDSAITSEATGFVVDAEKGYILTNRHVVSSGPFWGFCVFDNHEEVG